MITPREATTLLTMIEMGGVRPPNGYDDPANRAVAARVYAAALNAAGLTLAEAEQAVSAYLAEPDPGLYPKPWPDPGKLIARTQAAHVTAALGTNADADRAFVDFRARMSALAFRPDRDDEARHLDPADPYRNDAMFAALDAVGGAHRWGGMPTDQGDPIGFAASRKRWTEAYTVARQAQRRDPAAIRAIVTASSGRMLTVSR